MDRLEIGFIGISVLITLIACRVPIGVAMGGTAFAGIWSMMGWKPAMGIAKAVPFHLIGDWNLSAIPMFLLMGFISVEAGLTRGLFGSARVLLAWLPGGLATSTVIASSLFASASGSSVATSAAFARIAVPEMLKNGYHAGLATGSVAASGTLGALIPPSILMIIYGMIMDIPISSLFIAGIIPGILTAIAFVLFITIRCVLRPELAPKIHESLSKEEISSLKADSWPLPVIILLVMGGIFSGVFTATEAGAVGAFLAFMIALFRKKLSSKILRTALADTAKGTAEIFIVLLGAALFARFVGFSTIPSWVVDVLNGFSGMQVILVICILFLIMGAFLESISVMLLCLPILHPVLVSLDINLIWFCVLTIKLLEIGLVTPPMGMNVFVIKSAMGDRVSLSEIFKGAFGFVVVDLITLGILIIFPSLSLWLISVIPQ
ncbi:TRAP transporter large permease [Pelistega europaea]|uniref:TRAP transporter large permease protein n=1 Tax=Pelistega europaea TaxID=106147 RepID=A0A7Y4P324_9BURK|nr:TRAP transporter large permease subunit [Pelistega europaea]NOL48582.1 TRAP transporter large permease subunit [Pelistega europaea]